MAGKRTVKQVRVASELKRDMENIWNTAPLMCAVSRARWTAHPGGWVSCKNRTNYPPVRKRSKD